MTTTLSKQARLLALTNNSARLYTTTEVADRLNVRSMTLMRWVVKQSVACPKKHLAKANGIHWLWDETNIRDARKFKKQTLGKAKSD